MIDRQLLIRFSDIASLLRLHIVGIATCAALVFSWLMTGHHGVAAAAICAFDWLVINLLNRITDVDEDRANGIPATNLVARHPRAFYAGTGLGLAASFAVTHALVPELTAWRALVQLVGTAYSLPLLWTPRGWRRLKALYFLKNFTSAMLFVATCFVYPLALQGAPSGLPNGWVSALLLAAFFVCFELTYEIAYDLRDAPGDRAAGVPTYPVVHGEAGAMRIIRGLLLASMAILIAGVATGALGLREALMGVAPVVQWRWLAVKQRAGLTRADCIFATNLGSAMLLVYLAGNEVWLRAGLPANVVFR